MRYSHWRDHKKTYTAAKITYFASRTPSDLNNWQTAISDARNYLFYKKPISDSEKTLRRTEHLDAEQAAINKERTAAPSARR